MEGFENNDPIVEQPIVVDDAVGQIEQPDAPIQNDNSIQNIYGLSDDEMRDPNKIKAVVSDKKAPVIMLFGPASCGKTMTLVRLARYLKGHGYTLEPVRTFRPAHDTNYKTLCDNFATIVNSDDAANRTDHISFMLVKVIKDGRTLCQILEGPGELYFDPTKATQEWPSYVHTIFNDEKLRKIMVFFVEPNYLDEENRRNYVTTINQVKQSTTKQKHIFLYNKIDLTNFVIEPGQVHMSHALNQVKADYPDILDKFKNHNFFTSLWRPYNIEFVPFQTGTYTKPATGDLVYIQGSDRYPQMLWKKMLKCIKG